MIKKREILPNVPLYYSVPLLVLCIVALTILIFLFRIEYPELLLQPVSIPSNAINVSTCGVLSQDNSYYFVNQTLLINYTVQGTLGSCLIINGTNIVLDGNYQNIIHGASPGLPYNAVNVSGSNITVMNFNIQDVSSSILRNGIIVHGSNNSILRNNISNASENAIYVNGNPLNPYSMNNFIFDNSISNSFSGIFLRYANLTLIENNNIKSVNLSSLGIYLLNSESNIIRGNLINETNNSISVWISFKNLIKNNSIYSPGYAGLYFVSGDSNLVQDTKIISPKLNGLAVYSGLFTNISSYVLQLMNVSVLYGNSSHYDLLVPSFSGAFGYNFSLNIFDTYLSRYSINSTILRFSSSNLSSIVEFSNAITTSGNNLSDQIRTNYNYAEVKSNLNPSFNRSAVITFAGLPTNLNGTIFRDGLPCPQNICVNQTSLNLSTIVFNVTGWSNYTINFTSFTQSQPQNPQGIQTMVIDEPDPNEQYTTASFPNPFRVTLGTTNGSVKFSLNGGLTNVTMNTTDGLQFNYDQDLISVGNYTFIAYSNFTNGTRINGRVNFSIINTTGSSPGTSSGSSGGGSGGSGGGSSGGSSTIFGGSSGNNPGLFGGNGSPFNSSTTNSNIGTTQTLTPRSSSSVMRNMIYWLLIAVISIMIIILSIIIVRAVNDRKKAISSLNSPLSVKSSAPIGGLVSNLR